MAEMTHKQRLRLAAAVLHARMERYETKRAAYQAAGLNPATWDRIENGESVKDHTLIAVIKTLWPSAGGDWRRVPGVLEPSSPMFSSFSDAYEDPNYLANIERWVSELQDRVELLERHVYKQEAGDRDGDTALTNVEVPDGEVLSQGDVTLAARDDDDDTEAEAQAQD